MPRLLTIRHDDFSNRLLVISEIRSFTALMGGEMTRRKKLGFV